jgi:class 3 adenylate cyclase
VPRADPETEAEILKILEDRTRAGEVGQIDEALSYIADDADVVVYGTGEDEKVAGDRDLLRAGYEREFAQASAVFSRIDWHSVSVSHDGSVAWVALDATDSAVLDGRYITYHVRYTAVLERRMGRWLFVQEHTSMPGHAEGASFPTALDAIATAIQIERPELPEQMRHDTELTLLFTDIENSTSMALRLGDARWMETLRFHNAVVRTQMLAFGGVEVKSQGDGFMLAFRDPTGALNAAIYIQRELDQYNTRNAEEPIRVRIGAHSGGAIEEDDDFFGETVILASRVAALARPAEILVSTPLKAAVEGRPGLSFGEVRAVKLKGFAVSYDLYPLQWGR